MSRIAVVTGAAGQDGFLLTQRLLSEGFRVHATVHTAEGVAELGTIAQREGLTVHRVDFRERGMLGGLLADLHPDEFYNLAGQSSVAMSFETPSDTWRTNADAVQELLESLRLHSPATRFYQSSSSEMFGSAYDRTLVADEHSPLRPESPYAAAKSAAHQMCDVYRRAFGLRIACGILFNHESKRRRGAFLTRKVVDHVRRLRTIPASVRLGSAPLAVGNINAQRDWGFAPDYVDGIVRVARQIATRADIGTTSSEEDTGSNYRDYVLGSGQLHAVWELIDRAFTLAGLDLDWDRSAPDPRLWTAHIRGTAAVAIKVDPDLLRPSDPVAMLADAGRARVELGWAPGVGLDAFLRDMLDDE